MIFLGEPAKILGFPLLGEAFLRFNQVPGPPPSWLMYSEMDGYGVRLEVYVAYKIYWIMAGILLVIMTTLVWKRGLTFSIKERWNLVISRIKPNTIIIFGVLFTAFIGSAFKLYQTTDSYRHQASEEDRKEEFIQVEKRLDYLNEILQPTIKSVFIEMDIYPNKRSFLASGSYILVNETEKQLDTYSKEELSDKSVKCRINVG